MTRDKKKPNVLFILSDQHRFCDVGYAGNTQVDTPNLDALAAEGAYFSSAYSNCPLCVPARGTLLTGLHALKHGAAANDMPIIEATPSIAQVLNQAGYSTAYIGKWHLGGVPRDQFITEGRRLGFTYWNGCNCNHDYMNAYYDDNNNVRHPIIGYEPISQTSLALDYLDSQKDSEDPVALWLCFGTPHDPYLLQPKEDLDYYLEQNLTLRGNVDQVNMKDQITSKPDAATAYAGYYGHIRQLDRQIGRIVDWLKANNEYDNTIIVYTSDHGDMLSSHGYLNKQLFYDESARIPFVLSWPGHVSSGRRTQLISLVDAAPTILGLLNLSFAGVIDGRDVSPVLINPQAKGQDFVYFYSYVPCHQAAHREIESWRAVTDGKLMYAVDQNQQPICLYNLKQDPLQLHDLKDEKTAREDKARLDQPLDRPVALHDGYVPWEQLLAQKDIKDAWDASEKYFSGLWPRRVSPEKNE